jgi:glycosyltransferase involved in cell wall biosynthesis
MNRVLTIADLPAPPAGRTGWPWTEAPPPPTDIDAASLPRFSVVTPSYNQGAYLEETIRSVLLQGYPNLQYSVVDGGSSDDSVEIIRRYAPFLNWWVSEKDRGHTDALNKGFARSDGAVHAFLNSDDVYEPGALHAAARAIGPDRPWVVGQVRYLDETGRTWPLPMYPERSASQWFLHCPVPQPGAFWTADLHRRIGVFRDEYRFFFDYDFWMRMRFEHGIKPHVIPESIAVYRLHSQSKTVAQNSAFLADARAIRALHEGKLTAGERLALALARHRKRAMSFASRAKVSFSSGNTLRGAGQMLAGVLRWPPLLIDRRVREAALRIATGRRAVPSDEPPVVWNYYEE